MLVNAFIGFSGLAGLGLGDATVRFVARYRASGDVGGIAGVIRLTSLGYAVLGVLIPAVVYLAAPFLVSDIFSVVQEGRGMATNALRAGGFGISVRLLDNIPTAILQGYERFDLAAKVRIPSTILTMAVNVFLVARGFSVTILIVASVLILLGGAIVKAVWAKELLPRGLRLVGLSPGRNAREIRGFAFYGWLQAAGGSLLSQADRLLVASLTGTRTLTYYTVCVQFSQQIHTLLGQALSFLLPMASVLQVQGNTARLSRTFFASTNIVIVIAVGLGIPFFLLSHDILSLWMGSSFADEAASLLSAFVVVFTFLSTSVAPHYFMNAMGFHKLNTALALSAGIFVSVGTYLLVPPMGVIGAAMARLLSLPISIAGRTVIHFRVINDKRWNAGLTIFTPLLLLFAGLWMLQGISTFNGIEGWAKAGVVAFLTLLGTTLVGVFLLAFNRERGRKAVPATAIR
jgi:O-antigen/teichoic acid export membrane protein